MACVERRDLVEQRLVALGRLAPLVDLGLDRLEVGEVELDLDDARGARADRTGPGTSSSSKARSTKTMASTSRMWPRNLLPRPSPLLRPRDQAADVDELHGGRHDVLALAHLGQRVEAVVGHLGHARRWGRWWRRRRARRGRPPPASALYSDDLPALGRPTNPKRSMARRVRAAARRRAKRGTPVGWPATMRSRPRPSTGSSTSSTGPWPRAGASRPTPRRATSCAELGDDEIVRRHRARRAPRPARASAQSTGHVIALAVDGGIDEHLAELEAETAIDARRGSRRCGPPSRATATATPRGATAARRSTEMARDGRWRSATSTSSSPTTRPGSRSPTASTASGCSSSSTRSTRVNEELAPFRDPHRHGGRHPRGRRPRPGRRPARPARRRGGQRPLQAADGRSRR